MPGTSGGSGIGIPFSDVYDLNSLGIMPDSNPKSDVALQTKIFNEFLKLGGSFTLMAPGTYLLDNSLKIYSNSTLTLGYGVTLKNDSAKNKVFRPLLVGSLYSVAGTAIAITSSGTTATVTWTNHGLAINDWVAIAGAVETSYLGVFSIASVPTANTFTYVMSEAASATPATGTVLGWVADHDIAIRGGIWDYNEANLNGSDTIIKMSLVLPHIANLEIRGGTFLNAEKYCIFPINVRNIVLDNLRFDTPSDGIHFNGVNGAEISDIAGQVGDDLVALLSSEGSLTYTLGAWQKFPTRAVTIRNIRGDNCLQSGVKITGGDHFYQDIVIDGVFGVFGNSPVTIFEDIPFALSCPNIDSIILKNIRPDAWSTTLGCVRYVTSAGSGTIKRMEIHGIQAVLAGSQKLVDIRSLGAGIATVGHLVIRDLAYDGAALTGSGGGIVLSSNAACDFMEIDGFRMEGSSTNNSLVQSDGSLTRAALNNGLTHSGNGFFFRVNSGAGACDLYLSNVNSRTTNNPVQFLRACNLFASNWVHAGSTCININGTGTYNLRGGVTSANTHIAIAGGASVLVFGFGFSADPITPALAATVGQFLTSTQAGVEGGPAVLGPAGWVALGTGAGGINTVIV